MSINCEKILEELEEYFKNTSKEQIQIDMEIARYGCKKSIIDSQHTRVLQYICNIPVNNIEKEFFKFLDWEKKYETFQYYYRHKQTESILFSRIINVIEEEFGKPITIKKNEDFVSGKFKYMGYTFTLFIGQGSFWRIEKENKTIFQNI